MTLPWLRPLSVFAGPGAAVIDVHAHGARGDGAQDDTAAFQSAIDALPAAGGTVLVPPGRYLIDPLRSVRLRSGMHLKLDREATLVAAANAAERSVLLLLHDVDDVVVSGGRFLGERDRHLGTSGEWGHGIQLRGARRAVVQDVHVSRFWGDGVSVGAYPQRAHGPLVRPSSDVLLQRVVSTGNRRQALTIGRAVGVRVLDCEFSETGGTAPQAGIDVEPDAPSGASTVEIARCRIHGNRGPGIQLYKRTRGITIRDCTIERNRAEGVLAVGTADVVIANNRIRDNGLAGIAVRRGSDGVAIRGNRLVANAGRLGSVGQALLGFAGKGRGAQIRVDDDTRAVRVAADNRFD